MTHRRDLSVSLAWFQIPMEYSRIRYSIGFVLALLGMMHVAARESHAQFMVAANNKIQINDQQLTQMVFNQSSTIEAAIDRVFKSLAVHLNSLEQTVELSPSQRAKLELAGQGDLHRFFDDFSFTTNDYEELQISQQDWQKLHQKLRPLQSRFQRGIFGHSSLFKKTIPATLDDQQLKTYQKVEQARRSRRYRAAVKATIAMIDAQLPMTQAQRIKFEEVIMTKTKPPVVLNVDYYQIYIVLYQISKIQDEDLKPIFAEHEWDVIQSIQQQGRSMKRNLEANAGFIDN